MSSESKAETGEECPTLCSGASVPGTVTVPLLEVHGLAPKQGHVGGCLGSAGGEIRTVLKRDMTIELVSEDQQDWDPDDKTFSETELSPLQPPQKPARESGETDNPRSQESQLSEVSEVARNVTGAKGEMSEERSSVVSEGIKISDEARSVASESINMSGLEEGRSHVSSATNVTPIDSFNEVPEYEIPMCLPQFDMDHRPDASQNSREPSRSPIYSTVIKPGRLNLSQSMTTRAGTLSPGSGVVSYASSVIAPEKEPVSDYPISKQYTLGWVPKVPKKQRCVQVSVMEEDLRTVKREMLFCDIRDVSEQSRGLTFVNSTGEIVFRTCYDSSVGAYGVVLDDEKTLKRSSERMARVSRVVGSLFRLESSKTRDVWELRNPHSGKTNALIKLRKWNGFVSGCVHVTRGIEGVVNKSDIKIRRSRGDQDVVVTALLNDQIITTIRRGADRDCGTDDNIYSLFLAPYIDSVVVISIFTALTHLQLRYERPRSTSNLVGMAIASEARKSAKVISSNASKVKTTVSKSTYNVSRSISDRLKELEPHLEILPNVRVGTFPPSTPTTPKSLNLQFLTRKPEKSTDGSPSPKTLNLLEFRKKYADVRGIQDSREMGNRKSGDKNSAKKALREAGVELAKFGKQTSSSMKTTYLNVRKYVEKKRTETPTINAETVDAQ